MNHQIRFFITLIVSVQMFFSYLGAQHFAAYIDEISNELLVDSQLFNKTKADELLRKYCDIEHKENCLVAITLKPDLKAAFLRDVILEDFGETKGALSLAGEQTTNLRQVLEVLVGFLNLIDDTLKTKIASADSQEKKKEAQNDKIYKKVFLFGFIKVLLNTLEEFKSQNIADLIICEHLLADELRQYCDHIEALLSGRAFQTKIENIHDYLSRASKPKKYFEPELIDATQPTYEKKRTLSIKRFIPSVMLGVGAGVATYPNQDTLTSQIPYRKKQIKEFTQKYPYALPIGIGVAGATVTAVVMYTCC